MRVEEASASYFVPSASDAVDWRQTTLGEVADFEMGQAPPGSECNKEGIGTVFVKAGEFGSLYPVEIEWTTKPLKFGKKGDVFICVVGATAGKLNLGIDCAIGRSVAAIRPKEGIDTKFIYYQLQPWVLKLRASSAGSAQGVISKAQLGEVPLLVAPLDQQERIVAEIEKQFSRLDEAVANLKRVKANIKRYKAAVLKAAVEGCLVETEAERARREGRSYETGAQLLQRILETRRSQWQGKGKYKEPATPDTSDLPELPEGWVWASVDQLAAPEANSITDGPFGSNLKTEHYQEAGPRVIRLQNIKDGEFADEHAYITQEHFDRLSKHQIHAGDLVIASLGENPPRACIIPASVGPAIVKADCIRFKPHPSMYAKYLNAALNCLPTRQRVKDVLHGIGRPRLSLGEIRSIALPVPPEVEQYRIVAEIDRRISLLRETETQVDANLQRAERLRQSVLGKAYVG